MSKWGPQVFQRYKSMVQDIIKNLYDLHEMDHSNCVDDEDLQDSLVLQIISAIETGKVSEMEFAKLITGSETDHSAILI